MTDAEKIEAMDIVERIRREEGAQIVFICPNPDFNDLPDEIVVVTNAETNWQERRFGGTTLVEALRSIP